MATKPVKNGKISSAYGMRILAGRKEFHNGIDIISPDKNPPVFAAYSGIIHQVGWSKTFGNRVWVKCENGLYAVYPHLMVINENIFPGQKILETDLIGIMGNTGLVLYKGQLIINQCDKNGKYPVPLPYGCHLHFELRESPVLGAKSICPTEIIKLYEK